ncbi:MAG TPA: glycosyltransferase family 2 protein [Chthoniobacterales bacterium]|jgi:glycosyltransferase involved in cell wall biosynthesis
MRPEDITVAITVFNRRDFILEAIESALNQNQTVKVIVVEDCSPDEGLQKYVEDRFGGSISYHRNEVRRGLFGNWNACLDLCSTPWLSILHDDDRLAPDFVDAMIDLEKAVPGCGIYFSSTIQIDELNRRLPIPTHYFAGEFRRIDPRSFAYANDVLFPGQLFRVDRALSVGGFRESSQFCADWEMWFKLAFHFGAAQTARAVSYSRAHQGIERGTNKVVRLGRKHALDFVQAKRNVRLLRKTYPEEHFDRRKILRDYPLPTRELLQNAPYMTRRLVRYNAGLLLHSPPPNPSYALFQTAVRFLGPAFVLYVSSIVRRLLRRQFSQKDS